MLFKAVVVDTELDAYTSNGETYVLIQQLKEAFGQHLSYSSFMRRKYKIVRSENEQCCPSSILEEYKARGLVAGPSQRCTAVSLAQGRELAECCRSCMEGESTNSSSEPANVDVSAALTTEQTQPPLLSASSERESDGDPSNFDMNAVTTEQTQPPSLANSSSEQETDGEPANVDVNAVTTEQTQVSVAANPATGTVVVERFLQLRATDYPTFAVELKELTRYLSEPLSTRRRGDPLAQSTVQATERRLLSTVLLMYIACFIILY